MQKIGQTWEKDGFLLRPARYEDAEEYFSQNFNPLDPEIARLTGCKEAFTRDEVVSFFRQCVEADDRYDFLLTSPDGRIIGESVINEIDWDTRCANYRICIFHPGERGKGIVRLLCKKENFPLEFQRNTEGEFWKNPFPFLERGL